VATIPDYARFSISAVLVGEVGKEENIYKCYRNRHTQSGILSLSI
jgi:hypothetical protein